MEKVRWGVIGAGGIADRRTIPGMLKSRFAELVAVMSWPKEDADRVAQKYGVKAYYTVEELLADPKIDAVYIATPVYLHKTHAVAAAEAGKHFLLEKPLARTAAEAEEIVQAVRKAGVKATEGYMMKFHPLHKRAKELIEEGKLGKPVLGRAQLTTWYPDIPGAWRQDPEKGGGGALIDMATHCYDLLSWLMGSRIVQVYAIANTQTFRYPVDDSSTTLLLFENGAHGVVDSFFNIPDAAVKNRLEVYGDRGSIMSEGTIGQSGAGEMVACLMKEVGGYDALQERRPEDFPAEKREAEPADMYTLEVDYLSECILEDKKPEINTLESGLEIMRVVDAAYESARTGRAVKV